MAMIYPSSVKDNSTGRLTIEQTGGITKVYFTPENTIGSDYLNTAAVERWHFLDVNTEINAFTMYPFKYYEGDPIEPKYDLLSKITLTGFYNEEVSSEEEVVELLAHLPSIFVKDFNYGLGLRRDYVSVIRIAENLGIDHLIINKKGGTSINPENRELTIQYSHLEEVRKSINRVVDSARSVANVVKSGSAYNVIAYFLNDDKYPQKGISVSKNLISRLIGDTLDRLKKEESKNAIETIKRNTKKIIKENPEEIVKLKNDLELVSLEQLIIKFEEMLSKSHKEDVWQRLFNDNPFILNMAFGYPVIKIQDQASVGGKKISGDGDKIADFLLKNSFSNNVALFEIKTPSTKLFNKTPYRDNVFTPSADFAGAVNQILDQKHLFEQSIMYHKGTSKMYDIESYHVHGILIIGKFPTEQEQQKSFELYRGNSKSIAILTFDEVLEKLRVLHSFLSLPQTSDEEDHPF